MDKETARALMRVQIAMWVDGELACPQCKKPFASVDDYLARNPICGERDRKHNLTHVDEKCWPKYLQKHPKLKAELAARGSGG
jgi:hypothetical protein